jgi:hypothetical protein
MHLTEALKANLPLVSNAELIPISFGPVGVTEGTATSFKDAAMEHSKEAGSVAYIIRRPG